MKEKAKNVLLIIAVVASAIVLLLQSTGLVTKDEMDEKMKKVRAAKEEKRLQKVAENEKDQSTEIQE